MLDETLRVYSLICGLPNIAAIEPDMMTLTAFVQILPGRGIAG